MGSTESGFPVVVKRKEVVAAELPMQEHWLPMSNLDLLLPPLEVGVFFCYKKSQKQNCHETSNDENWMVSALKKSLAQALVSFYALAGEIVNNQLGEPELLCNNRGVDFIHAYADVELKHLDLHHPDASVHGKLVPALHFNSQGVLSVQATELKCGGLVVGCTFDHRVADAHSANMFFALWAEIAAAAKPISHHNHLPSFRRSLLTPRRPPPPPTSHNHPSLIDNIYVLLSSLPPPSPPNEAADELKSRIYYIDSEQINCLQSIASSSAGCEVIKKRSKLESFSAFLWKLIATGGDDPNKRCKLGVVIDGRQRLMSRSSSSSSIKTTMENYFGNVLSVPFGEMSVGELKAMELGEVAEAVHEFVGVAATEEHFRGLIDWVELHRPESAIVRVYCKLGSDDEAAVVVSSGQRFPLSKIDFGWGSPAFGSYHFPWGGQTGYVMPMPSTSRDGDWVVYMHLLQKHLDLVESLAPHMFKPLTPAYLNLL